MMMLEVVHICGPHTSVPGECDCYDACWSFGGACRTCDHPSCYRRGWPKAKVAADKVQRVEAKNGRTSDIVAMRFVCHGCQATTERLWKNVQRHWPRCCGQLMSETAIVTKVNDAG